MEEIFLFFCIFERFFDYLLALGKGKFIFVGFIHNIVIKLMYNNLCIIIDIKFCKRFKMTDKHFRINKFIALILVVVLCALALSSCKGRPLSQTKLAKTEVGKVGEYSVLYEEFYFLAKNYADGMRDDYANDSELDAAIWNAVNENITENYAILELCRQEGIFYDENELKKDVNSAIALDIEAEYDGSRSEYFKSQSEVGLTDHYVRFITGINILYAKLATEYRSNGTIPTSAELLVPYIQENFAHTWHIAVFINNVSEREEKTAKIQAAKKLLDEGTSMYDLIGSQYNEDVTLDYLSDAYGYYFPRGVMDEKYEDAAFSLNVNDNVIIESLAQNNEGKTVPCLYLIERLSTTSNESKVEIEKNLSTLSESLADAIINDKKEAIQKTLEFEPNDFAKGLDISQLEPVKNGFDYQLVLAISLSVVALAAIVVAIIVIRRVKLRKFQKSVEKYSKG